MSYEISLEIETGNGHLYTVYEDNYTKNVSNMFRAAIEDIGLKRFHGMGAEFAILLINKAILKMQSDPERYKKMNPENGWGDYEGALKVLQNLHAACVQHPLCTIHIC